MGVDPPHEPFSPLDHILRPIGLSRDSLGHWTQGQGSSRHLEILASVIVVSCQCSRTGAGPTSSFSQLATRRIHIGLIIEKV